MKPFQQIPFSTMPFRIDDTVLRYRIYAVDSKGNWKGLKRDDYPPLIASLIHKDMETFWKRFNAEMFKLEVKVMTSEEAKKKTKEQLREEINSLHARVSTTNSKYFAAQQETAEWQTRTKEAMGEKATIERELVAMRKVIVMLTEQSIQA